jgi:hypothetical protein
MFFGEIKASIQGESSVVVESGKLQVHDYGAIE